MCSHEACSYFHAVINETIELPCARESDEPLYVHEVPARAPDALLIFKRARIDDEWGWERLSKHDDILFAYLAATLQQARCTHPADVLGNVSGRGTLELRDGVIRFCRRCGLTLADERRRRARVLGAVGLRPYRR